MLDFDQMLHEVGEFGIYQKSLFAFQAPFCIFGAFVLFGQIFMTLYPETIWCEDHFYCTKGGKLSADQRQNLSFSYRGPANDPSEWEVDQCLMNNIDASFLAEVVNHTQISGCRKSTCNYTFNPKAPDNISIPGPTKPMPFSENKNCDRWQPNGKLDLSSIGSIQIFLPPLKDAVQVSDDRVYIELSRSEKDAPLFVPHRKPAYLPISKCRNIKWSGFPPFPSVVTEGGWWCHAEMYTTAATVVFFVGAIVGGFLFGYVADKYGRVPALVLANLFGALGGGLSIISTNIWLFMFFRFITGMAFDNCMMMMYILVLEFCGSKYRTLVANLSIAVFYTIGTMLLPVIARLIGNWRIYALVISLPMLLGLLAIFLVPESARWLLSKGKTKRATDILRRFAKVNRRNVDEAIFVEFEADAARMYEEIQAEEKDVSCTAAFATPRMRRTFLLLTAIWSLISIVYDGHSRNILNLADEKWDVFWMFGIASSTEFPADMFLIFTLDRVGRRWLSFAALTLSGLASIAAAMIPPHMRIASLVMAIVSRFFVNVAVNIGLQYAAELLPTVVRAQGVNAIHIVGYVAAILSPCVVWIGRSSPALSLIILGALSAIAGFLSLFLAETLGEDLPNTLEEAEAFGKNQSFWNCPLCANRKAKVAPEEEGKGGEGGEEGAPDAEAAETEKKLRNDFHPSLLGSTYRSSLIMSGPHHHDGPGGARGSRGSKDEPSQLPVANKTRMAVKKKKPIVKAKPKAKPKTQPKPNPKPVVEDKDKAKEDKESETEQTQSEATTKVEEPKETPTQAKPNAKPKTQPKPKPKPVVEDKDKAKKDKESETEQTQSEATTKVEEPKETPTPTPK